MSDENIATAGPQPWPQGEDYDPRQDKGPERIEDLDPESVDATPAAVEAAAELDVDIRAVEGTGAHGRVTVADVKDAADTEPAEDDA